MVYWKDVSPVLSPRLGFFEPWTLEGIMVRRISCTAMITVAFSLYCSPPAHASATPLKLSIEPRLLKTEFVPVKSKKKSKLNLWPNATQPAQEARFNSGLGLALCTPLLQLSLDYKVNSLLREEGASEGSLLNQSVGASVRSAFLNEFLKLDAGIDAQSKISADGGSFQYKFLPGFSRSLSKTTKLKIQYQYQLDKDINKESSSERKGYSMDLSGSLQNGRLSWKGSYQADSNYEQRQLQRSKSTERLSFKTRYRIASDLELELSSARKQQIKYAVSADVVQYETDFGAGLEWSPSGQYSLALKVDQREDSRSDDRQILGSGRASWFPRRDLSVWVDYGEQQFEGDRGVMLTTELRFGGRN